MIKLVKRETMARPVNFKKDDVRFFAFAVKKEKRFQGFVYAKNLREARVKAFKVDPLFVAFGYGCPIPRFLAVRLGLIKR